MGVRLKIALPAAALLAVVGLGVAMAAAASGTKGGTVKAAHNATYGSLLVSASGMSLYHYTLDKHGAIACTAACAQIWPPLTVKAGVKPVAGSGVSAAKLSTVKRPDGKIQVTYAGYPLYHFSGDKKPGQVNGQGYMKIWFAVTSKGTLAKASSGGGGGYGYGPSPTTSTDPYGGGGGY